MIEKFHLDAWRQIAPWLNLAQVEQDLVMNEIVPHLQGESWRNKNQ